MKSKLGVYEPSSPDFKQKLQDDTWNAFSIQITGENSHVFLLVQAVQNNRVVYKIFQSYVDKYTLKEYLETHTQTFSFEEVNVLLDELLEYVNSKNWTDKGIHLYKHFFDVDFEGFKGKPLYVSCLVDVRTGIVTRESFKTHALNYYKAIPATVRFKYKQLGK